MAASSGNLSTCKAVVGEGFNDFYATSVGRFGTPDGLRCDNISPYKIADMHEHEEITDFFNQCIHGTPPKVFTPKKAAVQQVSKDSYILEEGPGKLFCKVPSTLTINEEAVTRYSKDQKVELLIEELKSCGPLIGLGKFGPTAYEDAPFQLGKRIAGQEIYGWRSGSKRKEQSPSVYIIVIGAEKNQNNEYIYFVLSKDVCKTSHSSVREHIPSKDDSHIYKCSHKTFRDYLTDLYPIHAVVQDSIITDIEETLLNMPLEAILGDMESQCHILGQQIFDHYKMKDHGNSISGKIAAQNLCESISNKSSDGRLRKQCIERAWDGIGDLNWRWMALRGWGVTFVI